MSDYPQGISPSGLVCYEGVFQPSAYDENSKEYFNLTLAFAPEDLEKMRSEVMGLKESKFAGSKKRWRSPFIKGDDTGKPHCEGLILVRFKSKFPPGVVDHKREEIFQADDRFYSGCRARAFYNLWPWETPAEIGVSIYFRHVQKLGDGPRLVARQEAADVFDDVEVETEENVW